MTVASQKIFLIATVIVPTLVAQCSCISSSAVKLVVVPVTGTASVTLNQAQEYVGRQKCYFNNLAVTKQVPYPPEWSGVGI